MDSVKLKILLQELINDIEHKEYLVKQDVINAFSYQKITIDGDDPTATMDCIYSPKYPIKNIKIDFAIK